MAVMWPDFWDFNDLSFFFLIYCMFFDFLWGDTLGTKATGCVFLQLVTVKRKDF